MKHLISTPTARVHGAVTDAQLDLCINLRCPQRLGDGAERAGSLPAEQQNDAFSSVDGGMVGGNLRGHVD